MLTDHDFHPDEPTVRIFRTPSPGVLRLDDDVAISKAVYHRVVLRHYAFAGHWFKVNVTTGLSGCLTETGDPSHRFAVNCDIATPMEREGDSTFGVDLFTDVLVRDDATSYVVADRDEFGDMLGRGVISPAEGRGAEPGLRELLDLIEQGQLLRWLGELAPFGPCQPPPAQPMRRGPPRGEELVAVPAQQHGLGVQRLLQRDLGRFAAAPVANTTDLAAMPEALVAGRVLDDSVERDVLADDDLPHLVLLWQALSAATDADTAAAGTGRRTPIVWATAIAPEPIVSLRTVECAAARQPPAADVPLQLQTCCSCCVKQDSSRQE